MLEILITTLEKHIVECEFPMVMMLQDCVMTFEEPATMIRIFIDMSKTLIMTLGILVMMPAKTLLRHGQHYSDLKTLSCPET